MSENERVHDALERLEWRDGKRGVGSAAVGLTRRAALTGGAAGLTAALLEACGSAAGTSHGKAAPSVSTGPTMSIFGTGGGYRFTFVNHLRTNPFFIPTIHGAADACALLNCSYDWTGSTVNDVGEMVGAINTAANGGADGIATTLIAPGSFASSIAAATAQGIPVLSYNADQPGTERLAYVGQDLHAAGLEMGRRIHHLLPAGGRIMVFISTPGSANVEPRLAGLREALKGSKIVLETAASGVAVAIRQERILGFIAAQLTDYNGYFAVDAGSTAAVAHAAQRHELRSQGVAAGGFDLSPATERLLGSGVIDFTIDQQPYLQGFLTVLQLFLHSVTGGLGGTADVDTGARFLDTHTIAPYVGTASRYEGTGAGFPSPPRVPPSG